MKAAILALCFIGIVIPSSRAIDLTLWHKASNNYYYRVFTNKLSYGDAKNACKAMGATLATTGIRDPGVRSEWINFFDASKGRSIWVGLDDLEKQLDWRYLDGKNSCKGDEFWYPGEPNNNGGNERCAHMWKKDNYWSANDAPCHIAYEYVCEYKC